MENIIEEVSETEEKNVDTIDLKETPEYELKLVSKNVDNNEEKVKEEIKENLVITYKYYDIAVNDETVTSVNTLEEAEELVNVLNEENSEDSIELSILEQYSQKEDEIATEEVEVAKTEVQEKITTTVEEEKKKEELEAMPDVNGIKLATRPVTGRITSRYGVSSSIRKSTHTGLDIAATKGTPIQVVANGTVTCASYQGAYGNLVKVDHGNGVETWYGHTSKMYVKVGQTVTAGETIAAVGSTGNSTGPHLHFEIRVNGEHVNPQNYLYNATN